MPALIITQIPVPSLWVSYLFVTMRGFFVYVKKYVGNGKLNSYVKLKGVGRKALADREMRLSSVLSLFPSITRIRDILFSLNPVLFE